MAENIVLKLGGSTLYTSSLEVNWDTLKKVKDWYYRARNRYEKIVIVVGGGELSRDIQSKIVSSIGKEEYLHNIAMSVTQTNAAMVQGYLEDDRTYIPKRLGDAYEFLNENGQKTLISGGLKVGWSTDMDAATYADMIDLDKIYKISNVDYVYDSDPDNNPGARAYDQLTWKQYFDLFHITDGENHQANMSIPIDVMCAQFCSTKGISFFICGGKTLLENQNLENVFAKGTSIN